MIIKLFSQKKIVRCIFMMVGLFVFCVSQVRAQVTDIDIDNASVDENTSTGTAVGGFSSTGGRVPYTYSLVSGSGDEDNDKFTISDEDLLLNFTPDYENPEDADLNNVYSVRVKSQDSESVVATVSGADYDSAMNYGSGFYGGTAEPNQSAFVALKSDGSITAWGGTTTGGVGEPVDAGYEKIYSTDSAFAALKADGSITAWGDASRGGAGAPVDSGYTQIFSSGDTFLALKADGSITVWGADTYSVPTDSGYVRIYSNGARYAGLKDDGSITYWAPWDVTTGPSGGNFVDISSTSGDFAALRSDGSISAWGHGSYGGTGEPTDSGYTKIQSTNSAFAAMKADGSITAWGNSTEGGSGAPTDSGYTQINSTEGSFAALKSDGSITAWGHSSYGGTGAPTDSGYVRIYAAKYAFAALKSDGSITTWGSSSFGGSGAPTDSGYTRIYASGFAFAAMKADGSITSWGSSSSGSPSDSGYVDIRTTISAFIAFKVDGSIASWGSSSSIADTPIDSGYSSPYGVQSLVTVPVTEYEKQFDISINNVLGDPLEDIIIPNPDTSKISDAVNDGYVSVDQGIITNTDQVSAAVSVTFTSNGKEVVFPTGTTITEQSAGSFNFENFTLEPQDVTAEQQTSIKAFRLGIPGEKLSFSDDATVTAVVGSAYNDQELDILYQEEGESAWNTQGTCTVSNGECTFTTDHATIYTINGVLQSTGAAPMDINVEVQSTLSLDCHDTAGVSGDYDVSLGTTANPGLVTAGIPAVGQSTCTTTTNDQSGYYLTVVDDNGASNTVLTHTDPNTAAVYEISDLTQYTFATPNTQNWNAPTTKGLGFSVISFPDTNITNNQFNGNWTTSGNLCEEGIIADSADYSGIPNTPEAISAVTQHESGSTTTNICYKVDVPSSQPSGQYTGSVTYTATTDASSYIN